MDFLTSCLGTSRSETAALKKASASCPSDEEIIRFENELRQEQAAQDPLVSPIMPLSVLQEEFPPDGTFQTKLAILETEHMFKSVRRCRRDGNCFYRAVAFELCSFFQNCPQELIEACKLQHKQILDSAPYEHGIYEDFSEAFWSFCAKEKQQSCTIEQAWESDEYTANMALMLLRLLASAQIRSNPDEFIAFMELAHGQTIENWCDRNVDAIGVDADQVQLIALARAMNLSLIVVNLGNASDAQDLQINEFSFSQNSIPPINLLYRPGHYDLLYK
jgi:ubiquitin thioesterase protein OTUB1